jgi:hypothetical protein
LTSKNIIFERGISFLTILKLFECSSFQAKMVFKQSFSVGVTGQKLG